MVCIEILEAVHRFLAAPVSEKEVTGRSTFPPFDEAASQYPQPRKNFGSGLIPKDFFRPFDNFLGLIHNLLDQGLEFFTCRGVYIHPTFFSLRQKLGIF